MRTKPIGRCLGLSAVALTGLLAAPLHAAESDDYGDGYGAGNFGRVRYIDNGATITRGEWDAAPESDNSVNAPIFPGDAIGTGPGQRAEVQLASNHVVRIDHSTELTFLALPDPYAEVRDNAVLQLALGQVRLTVAGVQDGEEFRIDTPSATVYVLDDADLRVDVDGAGRTWVQSFRGVVEVVAEGGSVLVRSGTTTEVAAGLRPSDPSPFSTFALDDFDQWVEARESIYEERAPVGTSAAAYASVPTEVRPYYRELDTYGDWSHSNEYGYVWYPVSVDPGWRPYYHGSWGYGPSGYFWVSNEPWGWAPYHYGRWVHTYHGWGWVPGSRFAGAWVSWSWGPLYVGWSPIDCYDRPVYVSSVHHHYYDSSSWTFVSYRHMGRHDYAHYSADYDHVRGSLPGAAVVTRPPRVRPGDLVRSAEARQRAVRTARENPAPPPAASAAGRAAGSRPSFLERERGLHRQPAERLAAAGAVVKAPPASRFPRRQTASASSSLTRDTAAVPRPGLVKKSTGWRAASPSGQSTPAPRPSVNKSPAPRATETDKTQPTPRPSVIRRTLPRATDAGRSTPAPSSEAIKSPAPRATAPGKETGKTVVTPRQGFVISRPRATESTASRHAAPIARESAAPAPSKPEGASGPMHHLYKRMAQPRRTQAHASPPPSQAPQAVRPPEGGGGKGAGQPAPAPSRPSVKSGSPKSKPSGGRPAPPASRSGSTRHGSGRGR